jgi:transposase
LDNNASKREARGPALGHKNSYGSGALWSGQLAAMLFSLFATLSMGKINIRKWLTWFL